jgi:hypothetical protein
MSTNGNSDSIHRINESVSCLRSDDTLLDCFVLHGIYSPELRSYLRSVAFENAVTDHTWQRLGDMLAPEVITNSLNNYDVGDKVLGASCYKSFNRYRLVRVVRDYSKSVEALVTFGHGRDHHLSHVLWDHPASNMLLVLPIYQRFRFNVVSSSVVINVGDGLLIPSRFRKADIIDIAIEHNGLAGAAYCPYVFGGNNV